MCSKSSNGEALDDLGYCVEIRDRSIVSRVASVEPIVLDQRRDLDALELAWEFIALK